MKRVWLGLTALVAVLPVSALAVSTDYLCPDLAGRGPTILTIDADVLLFNIGANENEFADKIESSRSGFVSFGNFHPVGNGMNAGDTLSVSSRLLKTGRGVVQLDLANVSSTYKDTCHKLTRMDDKIVGCQARIGQYSFVDAAAKPKITKVSSTLWTYSVSSPAAGENFVYDVAVSYDGPLCVVGKITPVSCPAVIADAVSEQASDDGSSSGQPFVIANKNGTYTAGIHDTESGEFTYVVEVKKTKDNCEVTKVTPTEND